MSQDTRWFADSQNGTDSRPIIFPLIAWLAAIGFLIVFLVLLAGCATEKKPNDPKVCYLKLLGQTEEGYTVVVQQCVTTEEFQAAQK
jgi:hypothetical protein